METSRGAGGLFRIRDASELRQADRHLVGSPSVRRKTETGPFRDVVNIALPTSLAGMAFTADAPRLKGMSLDTLPPSGAPAQVFFDRRELDQILRVYGRMVAQGEWRDYAMLGGKDAAEFAVFRRSGDAPAYRIEKRPSLQTRQGQWAVIGGGGQILRRGRELAQVLRVFDARRFQVVE